MSDDVFCGDFAVYNGCKSFALKTYHGTYVTVTLNEKIIHMTDKPSYHFFARDNEFKTEASTNSEG